MPLILLVPQINALCKSVHDLVDELLVLFLLFEQCLLPAGKHSVHCDAGSGNGENDKCQPEQSIIIY